MMVDDLAQKHTPKKHYAPDFILSPILRDPLTAAGLEPLRPMACCTDWSNLNVIMAKPLAG